MGKRPTAGPATDPSSDADADPSTGGSSEPSTSTPDPLVEADASSGPVAPDAPRDASAPSDAPAPGSTPPSNGGPSDATRAVLDDLERGQAPDLAGLSDDELFAMAREKLRGAPAEEVNAARASLEEGRRQLEAGQRYMAILGEVLAERDSGEPGAPLSPPAALPPPPAAVRSVPLEPDPLPLAAMRPQAAPRSIPTQAQPTDHGRGIPLPTTTHTTRADPASAGLAAYVDAAPTARGAATAAQAASTGYDPNGTRIATRPTTGVRPPIQAQAAVHVPARARNNPHVAAVATQAVPPGAKAPPPLVPGRVQPAAAPPRPGQATADPSAAVAPLVPARARAQLARPAAASRIDGPGPAAAVAALDALQTQILTVQQAAVALDTANPLRRLVLEEGAAVRAWIAQVRAGFAA